MCDVVWHCERCKQYLLPKYKWCEECQERRWYISSETIEDDIARRFRNVLPCLCTDCSNKMSQEMEEILLREEK